MHIEGESLPWDSEVGGVLKSIGDAIIETTESSLVGLYVCGSLVAGDFDPEVSDIDLIAVLTNDPSDDLGVALKKMHNALARRHPQWAGRIEVVYVSAGGLEKYHEGIPRMAVIGTDTSFCIVQGGPDLVLIWYPARNEAMVLIGPPVSTVIPEIAQAEYLDAVRDHIQSFGQPIKEDELRGALAYAILTVCRGIYTLGFGARPSKVEAAAWAAHEFPHWAELIETALVWRKEYATLSAGRVAVADTRRFIAEMIARIIRQPGQPLF